MAGQPKRQKIDENNYNSFIKEPETKLSLLIIPTRFTKARLKLLKELCKSKGFPVVEKFSESVTHITTKLETREKVYQFLKRTGTGKAEIVTDEWLTACLAECKCVDVLDKHRLQPPFTNKELDVKRKSSELSMPMTGDEKINQGNTKYECQRRTPLNHFNSRFTKVLEILEKNAKYFDRENGESRALAFRRASCALKSFPREVEDLEEVSKLNYIGDHSKRVIAEIMKTGFSEEVIKITSSELFQVIELFVGTYGCGPVTAKKWYDMGYRNIQDIHDNAGSLKLNSQQEYGLEYYKDLNTPVSLAEAKKIQHLVTKKLDLIQPGCSIEIVGGFSRGKPNGHDVDILISHCEENKVEGLLLKLVDRLKELDYMLHIGMSVGKNVSYTGNISNSEEIREKSQRKAKTMDNLDRCFAIMKVDKTETDTGVESLENRTWIARRVDLIVTPHSQYAFSLLGWIGSKQFNRSLRHYAWKELKITVNNHGMWDYKVTPPKRIKARCEKDIFEALNLTYVERNDRNC